MRGFFLVSVSIHMGGMPYLVEQVRQLQSCHPDITVERIKRDQRTQAIVTDSCEQQSHGFPKRDGLGQNIRAALLAWPVDVQITWPATITIRHQCRLGLNGCMA